MPKDDKDLSKNEHYKSDSHYLRGTITTNLEDPITLGVNDVNKELLKFHGIYLQDNRDDRGRRLKKKLEPNWSFMVRIPFPGGVCTPEQWLALDELAHKLSNGALRLTTRQAVQYHEILRDNLRPLMRRLDAVGLCSMNGCGDITRNIMSSPLSDLSPIHQQAYAYVDAIYQATLAKTNAWREVWLEEEHKATPPGVSEEPLYGTTYMPRKFKIAIVIPPENDVDVFSQDIGLIAIANGDTLEGFNVSVGGGLGITYGEPETYPQIGKLIGFCPADSVVELCLAIIAIQRDHGDRSNRKHARMKYTIDDRGLDWFKQELQERVGWDLQPLKEFSFTMTGDRLGWQKTQNNSWHYTWLVENGRIKDTENKPLMTGIREIAKVHQGEFRFTPNQNLIIANVAETDKAAIEELIQQYALDHLQKHSLVRRNAMACVAFPTCPQAMGEAERYLPSLLDKVEEIMQSLDLKEEIKIRMSGCPNGCSRPYMAEIAFTGRAIGKYNMYLGGDFEGFRLNKLYKENIGEKEIFTELRTLLKHYKNDKKDQEHFGDFVVRQGYVSMVKDGRDFHG